MMRFVSDQCSALFVTPGRLASIVCVCVCVCVSAGEFCGLLRGAELNAGEGEVHCPELHLLIVYQQSERRLGQLFCSWGVFFQPLFLLCSCLAVLNVCVCVCVRVLSPSLTVRFRGFVL